MPETSVTFHVRANAEEVRSFLNDLQELGKCIVGVTEVRSLGPADSLWKVEVRAGFIAQLINLKAHIEAGESPNIMSFRAEGQNLNLSGTAKLREEVNGTTISLKASIEPTGPLAGLVNSVLKNTQQKLIDQTVSNLRARLEAVSGS